MSTYGTAVVIDVPDDAGLDVAVALLQSADSTTDGAPPRGDYYATSAPDGWRRVTAYVYQPGLFEQFPFVLPLLGTARVASAEDFDEFGALWIVVAVENGVPRTVHRRWLFNADPHDPEQVTAAIAAQGEDPRDQDVAGDEPARAAANVFGIEPTEMIAAERASDQAHQRMGVVGGPFPWWDALALPWPQPGAGTLLAGSESTPADTRPADPSQSVGEPPRPRRWWRRGGG